MLNVSLFNCFVGVTYLKGRKSKQISCTLPIRKLKYVTRQDCLKNMSHVIVLVKLQRPHEPTWAPDRGSCLEGKCAEPLFQGNLGWWNIMIWPDLLAWMLKLMLCGSHVVYPYESRPLPDRVGLMVSISSPVGLDRGLTWILRVCMYENILRSHHRMSLQNPINTHFQLDFQGPPKNGTPWAPYYSHTAPIKNL